jgi:hypothetical protein
MNQAMLKAFGDELEKLAYLPSPNARNFHRYEVLDAVVDRALGAGKKLPPAEMAKALRKEAAFLQNVGNRIVQGAERVGGFARKHTIETGENIGQAIYKTVRHPIKGMKAGWKDPQYGAKAMFRGGLFNKAMGGLMVAGTAMGLNDLRKKQDPSGQNRGRLERIGDFAGQTAGGLIGAPHGITGGIAGTVVGSKILGGAGRVADKVIAKVRRKGAPPSVQPDQVPQKEQG